MELSGVKGGTGLFCVWLVAAAKASSVTCYNAAIGAAAVIPAAVIAQECSDKTLII